MPRAPRQIVPDVCYHVLNRGNDRRRIFHKQQDYLAFIDILTEGLTRYQIELFCWCLMPNHWHLVLRSLREKALSDFMRWVTVTHVRRYYEHYPEKSGHLYQGRFKAFPVEEDRHFLTLGRYVEANAKRADLVEAAEQWQWSSLNQRITEAKTPPIRPWPVDRPKGWIEIVNQPLVEAESNDILVSLDRGRPLGSDRWMKQIAIRTGLSHTLQSIGRPLKAVNDLSPRQQLRRLNQEDGQKGK